MQKKSVFLALSLAFSATVWANDVTINGTGVSLEANKTPINTAKNPQAIAQLPANLHRGDCRAQAAAADRICR